MSLCLDVCFPQDVTPVCLEVLYKTMLMFSLFSLSIFVIIILVLMLVETVAVIDIHDGTVE